MGLKKFDYRIKDNRKKKSIIVAAIIVLVLLVGLIIYVTFAEYKVTKTYNLIQGKVSEFSDDDLVVTVKIYNEDGTATTATDFPSKDSYMYYPGMSSCTNGSMIEFDLENWNAKITATQKDKCTISFKEKVEFSENSLGYTLLNAYGGESEIVELDSFSTSSTTIDAGMYKALDDYGMSYYYRGNVTDNYVQFGQDESGTTMNWRIVRINGDGTIRLVYQGTESDSSGLIAGSIFNANNNHKKYVGYMYGTDENPYENTYDSEAKKVIDNWYVSYLNDNYSSYIADSIFCNDRSEFAVNEDGSIIYSAYNRLPFSNTAENNPTLTCSQQNDRFTKDDTILGNGDLTYPIGMLTADEARFLSLGEYTGDSINLTGNTSGFWMMTPYSYNVGYSGAINYLSELGNDLSYYLVNDGSVANGIAQKPVINLKSNVEFTGAGTIDSPYVITTS